MSEKLADEAWVRVQKKTFTRWANNFLKDRSMKIDDLSTDLKDGMNLINLLEILSSKSLPKYNKAPKNKMQSIENLGTAIHFVERQGVKLVGIGPQDIYDGNLKLILGLIWTLILRFQIQRGGEAGNAKNELLEWVRKQVAPYGLKPKNFSLDWTDGKLICALTDSLRPGTIDMANLSKDPLKDTELAMETALNRYEIPRLIDAKDMVDVPDELSTMTYVSYFRDWYNQDLINRAVEIEEERQRKMRTADPAHCYAFGPGLEGGSTNNDNPFTIQSKNYFDDKLTTGGNEFIVEIDGPEKIDCQVQDNGDGTYSCNYVPKLPGSYTVNISLRGSPIKGSPYGPVKIVGPDNSRSYATGPGVELARLGQPANFQIHSVAADGSPLKTGNDPFTVHVTSADGSVIPVELTDNKDGTYDGSYVPTVPGVYTVQVLLYDQPIKNSPYHPLIEQANAGNSWADGPGLKGGKTGPSNPIYIHAVDGDGNPISVGGDPFKVHIKGPEELEVEVVDNGDGTYTADYGVTTPGDYTIEVTLHGQPLKDAPFHVHFLPDVATTTASGPGVEGARVGQSAPFKVLAKDSRGNLVKTGGDPFTVNVKGPDGVPLLVQFSDNHDGTYDCSYTPTKPGFYTVDVLLNNEPIHNSPFHPLMEAANAHQSWAEGPGLKGGKTGRSNPITIHAVDADGNPVPHGGDPFVVGISGPEAVVPSIVDNGDGTYSVDYVVASPGEYQIDISLHGTPIKGGPFNVVIKPDVDASKCYAEGPGLERAFDNEVATFTIFARDGDDQPKTDGGDNFQLEFNGPSDDVHYNVQDNNDGTYTVTYEPLIAGDYSVNVHLNGKSIKNAPFHVSVVEGTDVSTTGFKLFTFTILTKDENDQARTFGGDAYEIEASGPSQVHFSTKDNGDGTYTSSYLPDSRGSYTIHVKFNDQELAVSPLHQNY